MSFTSVENSNIFHCSNFTSHISLKESNKIFLFFLEILFCIPMTNENVYVCRSRCFCSFFGWRYYSIIDTYTCYNFYFFSVLFYLGRKWLYVDKCWCEKQEQLSTLLLILVIPFLNIKTHQNNENDVEQQQHLFPCNCYAILMTLKNNEISFLCSSHTS